MSSINNISGLPQYNNYNNYNNYNSLSSVREPSNSSTIPLPSIRKKSKGIFSKVFSYFKNIGKALIGKPATENKNNSEIAMRPSESQQIDFKVDPSLSAWPDPSEDDDELKQEDLETINDPLGLNLANKEDQAKNPDLEKFADKKSMQQLLEEIKVMKEEQERLLTTVRNSGNSINPLNPFDQSGLAMLNGLYGKADELNTESFA